MARGGRLDEEAIKDKLYDMGVDYEELLEQGEDLDAIQDQYLGYRYDSDTNTWSYAKGGKTDEDIFVVDVVWRQLNEKGLGKFPLKESDIERLEDDYGSTYYFEPYDYTNEKPISYSKMKNILDKSMKEMGLMDRNFAKGGTMDDAEERAFAEYMEDYGVDREEAEEQFLGEFDNKAQWAAEFVDDMGGMESLIDPERFYRIDKVGFREWAINMADSMVMDIDEDNVEEYAERHNLEDEFEIAEAKEERYPNKPDGYGHMDRFVEKVKEEEHESIVYVFEAENRDAQDVIANIGSDYGMSLDDLERAYLIIPDYDEVADALEDDGYVFIEEDFKTFVFNPNMARGGRTKRMKKGGKVYDSYDEMKKDYDRYDIRDAFEDYIYDRISHEERRKIRQDWNDMDGYVEWETYLLKRVNEKSYAKGGKVKGLDKYGSWYYMDDDGTLFVRYQEVGEDKAPKWDEDDDEWGVVEERAFGTMERQEFEKDMKKLFGRKPKLN